MPPGRLQWLASNLCNRSEGQKLRCLASPRIRCQMGKVVKIDASGAERTSTASRTAPRQRPRRSKTALVLGGGGLTGGVYETGAMRALDLLSGHRTGDPFG